MATWSRMVIATVTMIWVSSVMLQVFSLLCVLKRCSLPIFLAKPNFSKTLQSLLMQLVVFANTINFAAKFTCPGQSSINQSQSIWFRPAYQCNVWNLKQTEEVCVDLHDHGNHNSLSHKSSSSIIGSLFYSVALEIGFLFCI